MFDWHCPVCQIEIDVAERDRHNGAEIRCPECAELVYVRSTSNFERKSSGERVIVTVLYLTRVTARSQ